MQPSHDDLFNFADEHLHREETTVADNGWQILIVDDEADVHEATQFALKNQTILGRPLHFTLAYSAQEAKDLLAQGHRFACILLDVVMETEDAGLTLITYIRDTLNDQVTRIILRTGQPGYAPELHVIERYDINDYKAKDELTRTRLITSLTAAIRAYQQICNIEDSKTKLGRIIEQSPQLFRERSPSAFAEGVLQQLCRSLDIPSNGLLCLETRKGGLNILAADGHYHSLQQSAMQPSDHPTLFARIHQTLKAQQHSYTDNDVLLFLDSPQQDHLVIYLETGRALTELEQHLLAMQTVNCAVGFDNARMFQKMEALAFDDVLTRLPNRNGFTRLVAEQIDTGQPFTLILADIDNFQAINDGLGYLTGNALLKWMAKHLKTLFPKDSLLGRVSSDIFSILLPHTDAARVVQLLEALEHSFDDSVDIDEYEIPVSLTMGLVRFPEHGRDADQLMQYASIALKHAKKNQRAGYTEFGAEYEQALQNRLHMAAQLRHCVERNELKLVYQPQVCLANKQIIGAEALVRWQHQDKIIPPNDFISTAESSGYIVPMGYWILEEACRQQVAWHNATGQALKMAVNVSVRQLKDPLFIERLDTILQRTQIATAHLEMEVTESLVMDSSGALNQVLHSIRARGIQLAMDDFGTGYSSLSYLQHLPINHLKIDRSFINRLLENHEGNAITALMIQIGKQLNLSVIAEGVETEAQQDELIRLGCPIAQGYLYSKPLLESDFRALLLQQSPDS